MSEVIQSDVYEPVDKIESDDAMRRMLAMEFRHLAQEPCTPFYSNWAGALCSGEDWNSLKTDSDDIKQIDLRDQAIAKIESCYLRSCEAILAVLSVSKTWMPVLAKFDHYGVILGMMWSGQHRHL